MKDIVPLIHREPPRGKFWGPEVLDRSGLEMMRASVEHALPDPPLTKLTGLRLSEVGLGMASASMPASVWWQSGAGVFLAGTIWVAPIGAFALVLPPAARIPMRRSARGRVSAAAHRLRGALPRLRRAGRAARRPLFLAIRLPAKGIGILIAVDAIPDTFASALNSTGNLAAVAWWGEAAKSLA